MTIFDLLFIVSALAGILSLLAAAGLAFTRRRATSRRIVRVLGLYVVTYLVASAGVSLFTPQRVLGIGEPWCFDDWCLTVQGVSGSSSGTDRLYDVAFLLTSRAGRRSQRALGAWAYLIDADARRFSPEARATDVPLDTLLGPGESVRASRVFRVPGDVRPVGFVTGHGGPYCGAMSLLIIGSGRCLFRKPTMVRLP